MSDLEPYTHYDDLLCTPVATLSDWTFDDNVAQVFQNMIQRSVPGYATIISMTGTLAARFVQPYSHIYDLGCSLCASTIAVHNNIRVPGCKIIAVDNSPAMITRCREQLAVLPTTTPVELIEASILDIKPENASMIVLNFTLQFLDPACRQHLMNQLYTALLPGGVLIMSEKFTFNDEIINELLYNMHHDFKRANGYSELEINQKRTMLENVMRTDSVETHQARLHKAGFAHSEVWFQYLNFGSLLALKAEKAA